MLPTNARYRQAQPCFANLTNATFPLDKPPFFWYVLDLDMATNPKLAAKHAKKKHQKELKRKAKKAALRSSNSDLVRAPMSALSALSALSGVEKGKVITPTNTKPFDGSIGAYARRINVPFLRAAFEISHPDFGATRDAQYPWTLRKMAACTDSEILDELRQIGLEITRDVFRAETANRRSAIAYAHDEWISRLSESPQGARHDFICLAAHELWKRWNEDHPTREMAVEALLHMHKYLHRDELVQAIESGVKCWSFVTPDLTDDVRTLEALEEKLGAGRGVALLNLFSDFALAAPQIVEKHRELGGQALRVVEVMARQFSDESKEWHEEIAQCTAELAYRLGETQRAESILQSLMDEYPLHAGAYVTLAELWSSEGEEGLRRALALLERAEAMPLEDGRDCELPQQIEEIYWGLGNKTSGGPGCNFAEQSTPRLVRWLKMAFEDVSNEHIEEIGRRGSEAIAPLMLILRDDYYWNPICPDEGAALRNAFRAIGAIGTQEAGQALMAEVISKRAEDELPEEAFWAMRLLTPREPARASN